MEALSLDRIIDLSVSKKLFTPEILKLLKRFQEVRPLSYPLEEWLLEYILRLSKRELKNALIRHKLKTDLTYGEAVMELYHYDLCSRQTGIVEFHTEQTFLVDASSIPCASRLGRLVYGEKVIVDPKQYNTTEFSALLAELQVQTSTRPSTISTPSVRPSPSSTVRPSPPSTVRPSPPSTVRPSTPSTVRPSTPSTPSTTTVRPSTPSTPSTTTPSTTTIRPSSPVHVAPSVPQNKLEHFYSGYIEAIEDEVEMREQMYQERADPRFFERTYGLVQYDPDSLNKLYILPKPENKDRTSEEDSRDKEERLNASFQQGLLFSEQKLRNRSQKSAKSQDYYIGLFKEIIAGDQNIVIAGGAVFTALFDNPLQDIDVFLTTKSPMVALTLLRNIVKRCKPSTIIRTKNSITLLGCFEEGMKGVKVQVILRLYNSISEVLHGFDVDSSCMGYDGRDVWLTQRCAYAIKHGINTVNFDRLSPTYEIRLAKYAARGMSVYVPNFDSNKVKQALLDRDYTANSLTELRQEHNIEGLSVLLIANERANHNLGFYRFITKYGAALSDYSERIRAQYGISLNELADIHKKTTFPELHVNSPYIHGTDDYRTPYNWTYVSGSIQELGSILAIPPSVKTFLGKITDLVQEIPLNIEWKTTEPGEQMTNTFHKIVLENVDSWYNGYYYGSGEGDEEDEEATISQEDPDKMLFNAVKAGSIKAAKLAINSGATMLNAALAKATKLQDPDMMKFLLQNGAEESSEEDGSSEEMNADERLAEAIDRNNPRAAVAAVRAGASAVHGILQAAQQAKIATFESLVNELDLDDQEALNTLLAELVSSGRDGYVRFLLQTVQYTPEELTRQLKEASRIAAKIAKTNMQESKQSYKNIMISLLDHGADLIQAIEDFKQVGGEGGRIINNLFVERKPQDANRKLIISIENDDMDGVVLALQYEPKNVNEALIVAAEHGSTLSIDAILKYSVNNMEVYLEDALYAAVEAKQIMTIRHLIREGADVRQLLTTIRRRSVARPNDEKVAEILRLFLEESVKRRSQDFPEDVEEAEDELIFAIYDDDISEMEKALDKAQNVEEALLLAIELKKPEMVKILMPITNNLDEALFVAAQLNDRKMMELLIEGGAPGDETLTLAHKIGDEEAVWVLQDYFTKNYYEEYLSL